MRGRDGGVALLTSLRVCLVPLPPSFTPRAARASLPTPPAHTHTAGPLIHCVVWHDGAEWLAALDTSGEARLPAGPACLPCLPSLPPNPASQSLPSRRPRAADMYEPGSGQGLLADFAPMTNYRVRQQVPGATAAAPRCGARPPFPPPSPPDPATAPPQTLLPPAVQHGTFSAEDACNFALNIYEEGSVLSVVVDAGSHGCGLCVCMFAWCVCVRGGGGGARGGCCGCERGCHHTRARTGWHPSAVPMWLALPLPTTLKTRHSTGWHQVGRAGAVVMRGVVLCVVWAAHLSCPLRRHLAPPPPPYRQAHSWYRARSATRGWAAWRP